MIVEERSGLTWVERFCRRDQNGSSWLEVASSWLEVASSWLEERLEVRLVVGILIDSELTSGCCSDGRLLLTEIKQTILYST